MVVPIFKVEKYLEDCLESLIHQTYENLEIILVDDKSPDRCGAICDEYAKRDERIKVVHRDKNGGASAARNSGIDVAKGEYLFLMDGDDWIVEDAIEYLMENMLAYHADCCVGGCVSVLEKKDGSFVYQERTHMPDHCESAQKAMKMVLLQQSASWNRLFRMQIFEELRFPEGRINEDEPVMLKVYADMERILFLDKNTYFYRKRKNSVTTSDFSMKKIDCVINSRENLEFVKSVDPELIPAAEFKYVKSMLWCYVNLRKLRTDEARMVKAELRREIRKNRKMALRNPYLGFPLKVLAFLLH